MISQEEQIEPQELIEGDVVTVYGIDKTIVSIILDNGHGYLRLENGDYFVDGWIEVGQEMIYPITEDMLLTVPEGKHQILVSKNGTVGIKEATIERNQETKLDVSDVQGEEKRSGNVVFTINPSKAKVYIDAKEVDTSKIITLEYGIHQMTVVAEGYQTIRQYLKVGQENASISIEMEKTEEESKNVDEEESTSVSSNTVTGSGSTNSTDSGNSNNSNNSNSESNTTTDKNTDTTVSSNNVSTSYRIKIEAPVGAEVYFNGNYMGIVPIDFKKESGNHTIILRKNGYQTRSYSVQIDDEKKDVNYSFSDLIAIE